MEAGHVMLRFEVLLLHVHELFAVFVKTMGNI